MAVLGKMPPIVITADDLRPFGEHWQLKQSLPKKPPYSSMRLGNLFDARVGAALAAMLGNIRTVTPSQFDIRPAADDVVEVGPVRIVGGVRPQNFDVGYRPDGVRIAFDSKTLNDTKSVGKNYQNMINDLGTEATTVHTRFPYAVVAFMVIIPEPCLLPPQRLALTRTLERLTGRIGPIDSAHKAEAISLILRNPIDGSVDTAWPNEGSPLRIELFSSQVERHYVERYKGLPPHDVDEPEIDAEAEAQMETSQDG